MRLLVLDKNLDYSRRLKYYLTKKYKQVQMTICDSLDAALGLLDEETFDAVLFDSAFDDVPYENIEAVLGKAAFAYLSETHEIIGGKPTFLKYSRVSDLYEKICKLYADKKNRVITGRGNIDDGDTEILLFLPVEGGAGSSTLAAACTKYFGEEANVLYVDLEQNSSAVTFFPIEEKRSMSDIATMLRTKYSESALLKSIRDCCFEINKTDNGSVTCIKGFANVLDSTSLTEKGVEEFIQVLREKFNYRYIVIDADFIVGGVLSKLICNADKTVFVTALNDTSALRMKKIHRYIDILRRTNNGDIPEMFLIYNKYTGTRDDLPDTRDMKVLPRVRFCRTNGQDPYSADASEDVIKEILSGRNIFGALI